MSKRRDDVTTEDAETAAGGDNVIIHIKGLLKHGSYLTKSSKPTIFEVDDRLRKVNQKDYEPNIVSIGPIHHRSNLVSSMQQQKVRFLEELLDGNNDLSVEKLVEQVRKIKDDASRCYSKSSIFDKDKFLEILLLDGCFVIHLIRKYFFKKSKDPIFESGTLSQIIRDLLLFENQLPFFVLSTLFDVTKIGSNPDDNLRRLILFLVGDIVPWLDDSKTQLLPEPDHLLGLVYQCVSTKIPPKLDLYSSRYKYLLSNHPDGLLGKVLQSIHTAIALQLTKGRGSSSSARAKKSSVIHINSASELKVMGGIRLKMSEENSLTFARNLLRFPPLQVSGETESLLRNMMAYEQLQLGDGHQKHVIDYVFFLHCLARSNKDVKILRYSGIIKNYLGGDDKILEMLDRLGTNFMRSSEYTYSHVFESLNIHCNRQNQWRASLMRNWSLIKFLAATFLLLVASTQALFAILSYRKQKDN